jgi:hypothetical protein
MDKTDALIIENLKKAGELIREAAQMTLPKAVTPEDAVHTVVALMFRAIIPREASLEFTRLGGTNVEVFRNALMEALHGPR